MDLVLVGITGISLVLAIIMGFIVFKLLREERQRSEARVALLKSIVGEPSRDAAETEPVNSLGPDRLGASMSLFATPETESPQLRRAGIALLLAVLVVAVGFVLTRKDAPSPARSTAMPLELISLQHTSEADALTISGTLLNPRGGTTVTQIAATAFVFSAEGHVLGSGRAPLDYRTLAPGEESGFLIKVPVQGVVSRYRVGFRRSDGSVVTHVDRRTDGPSARHTGSTENAPWVR